MLDFSGLYRVSNHELHLNARISWASHVQPPAVRWKHESSAVLQIFPNFSTADVKIFLLFLNASSKLEATANTQYEIYI